MWKNACEGNPTMEAHWKRAEYYSQVRARYDAELAAYRAMRAKWQAQSGGRTRRAAAAPRSHRPRDAYADLTRAETDRLIEEDQKAWHERHVAAFKGQLAHNEPLLKAIANDAGVPRSVLTALNNEGYPYLLAPVIQVDLPGLGSNLVMSNWDHIDKGWDDDPSVAIRKLGLRRLTWDKLNKKLPGYEHLIKDENAAERLYLDAYLNSALCFDRSFGGWFQLEFPIKDEAKWSGKKTTGQQHDELYYIRDHLLKGAILGATKGRAEAAWNSST